MARRAFLPETLEEWRANYDIDFSPLVEAGPKALRFYIRSHSARDWHTFSEPVLFADIDLTSVQELYIDSRTVVTAQSAGHLNGVIVYFEAELGPTTRLSTHPAQASAQNSWRPAVWHFSEGLSLQPGDRVQLTYKYRVERADGIVSVSRA